jgi:hypothetical protein
MAGLAGALLIFQYSVHPFFGGQFGPLTFMICVLGGLGNMVGAFIASFIMSEIISIGGVVISTEMGYVIAFVIFIVLMFVRPGGILVTPVSRLMTGEARRCWRGPFLPLACAVRDPRDGQILIWSFIAGPGRSWAFGLVSLGHGAFSARRLHLACSGTSTG